MPDPGTRDLYDEIATLREELEALRQVEAKLGQAEAELARWTSGQRRKGLPVVDAVPDGIEYAARLARSIGTEGGEEHDLLLSDAAQRMKTLHDTAAYLIAQRDGLRAAVRHIVAMVEHGTPLPQMLHAVVELREALDGGT